MINLDKIFDLISNQSNIDDNTKNLICYLNHTFYYFNNRFKMIEEIKAIIGPIEPNNNSDINYIIDIYMVNLTWSRWIKSTTFCQDSLLLNCKLPKDSIYNTLKCVIKVYEEQEEYEKCAFLLRILKTFA